MDEVCLHIIWGLGVCGIVCVYVCLCAFRLCACVPLSLSLSLSLLNIFRFLSLFLPFGIIYLLYASRSPAALRMERCVMDCLIPLFAYSTYGFPMPACWWNSLCTKLICQHLAYHDPLMFSMHHSFSLHALHMTSAAAFFLCLLSLWCPSITFLNAYSSYSAPSSIEFICTNFL